MRCAWSFVPIIAFLASVTTPALQPSVTDTVATALREGQRDLATTGTTFLVEEAAAASFFMIGELHGDNETPALVRSLWPPLWKLGYRHIAAELSPWAATRLEFPSPAAPLERSFSWSQLDVRFVSSERGGQSPVLWGCDMEEIRPHLLIRELAVANPHNEPLQAALKLTESGYERKSAPALLELIQKTGSIQDPSVGGTPVRSSLERTLQIEIDRMKPDTRLRASTRREGLMKEYFHRHWETSGRPKVMLRFGGNHLHRGIDRRGVSTLGNFVAELAAAHSSQAFNVAEVAGGGKIPWGGQVIDYADELTDPALAFLASIAQFPATVFDLRPVRQALHRIAEEKRSPAEASLVYWADSFDAILFYREATPRP